MFARLARPFSTATKSGALRGHVKWFDMKKGFGFLTQDGAESKDVFVHYSSIRSPLPFKSLNDGDSVAFTAEFTSKGLQAVEVWPDEVPSQNEQQSHQKDSQN